VRSSEPPDPLVPAEPGGTIPRETPLAAVLGYSLAQTIFGAHGGSLRKRGGAGDRPSPRRLASDYTAGFAEGAESSLQSDLRPSAFSAV